MATSINTTLISDLWVELRKSLQNLKQEVLFSDQNIISDLDKSSNESFVLRAYLTFMVDSQSDEISVSVDIKTHENRVNIESDICGEDGEILFEGPMYDGEFTKGALYSWLQEYRVFLSGKSEFLIKKIAELKK